MRFRQAAPFRAILAAVLAVVVAAGGLRPADSSAAEAAVELRIMTFNIWYGGQQVDFAQVAAAIRAARADIVGIQESDGGLRAIAEALGWPYVDERHDIISRYPLFQPPVSGMADPAGLYVYAEVAPGGFVAVGNLHLPATPYGPEAVRDGKSAEEIATLETETRLPAATPYIEALSKLAASGMPVFLTGDFNSPSHLDWTAAALKARPEIRYALAWPVSKAAAEAGLRDSFREAHPDPVRDPGLTWTDGYPHPWIKPGETFDRIDFVWTAGNSRTLTSEVVGESDNPAVPIGITPYPSDHRSVVSGFRVVPAGAPPLVAVDRRVITQGDDILLRFSLAGLADARASVLPRGGDPAKDAVMAIATGDGSDRPSIKLGSLLLAPGAYEAALQDAEGKVLARAPFWIRARDALPEVAAAETVVKAGAPVKVSWRNAPGMKHDWIAIYKAGDPDMYGYLAYLYTGAEVEGEAVFATEGNTAPHAPADYLESPLAEALAPGEYELRLLRDDSYVLLARAPFTVKAP